MSDYKVIEVGGTDSWSEAGKRFVEKELGAQFIGISVNATEPGGESPFWHSHAQLEEIYIVIDGEGELAVGDDVVPLTAGTIVRAGQGVPRALRCLPNATAPLRWLCVRAGGDELGAIGNDADLDSERPFPWNS